MVGPNDSHLTPDAEDARLGAPTDDAVSEAFSSEVSEGAQQAAASLDGPRDVPRPIGTDRMRALRELIESGQYPSADDVAGGLFQMFDRSE